MTTELDTIYDPQAVERDVYEKWIAGKAFHADPTDGDSSFCMVIPPPNVTAALHLGHALNNTLQDILVRFKRMAGLNTLWMPGTDHAGIATQTVVEKRILAEEGKRRTEFDRDEFVGRIQQWKDEYEATILNQLQKMGCSCDWDRTRFTMDDVCAKAVRANFFKLFTDGLIYRGKRLVNWDPATQTVLADDEVEHETVKGHFWYLRYPLETPVEVDGQRIEHVTVATTRPETMLGDTAVAMNPADPRAEALKDVKVRLPIVGRLIPIVLDEHVVLPDPDSDDDKAKFSTGFLKVTPAHDPDDWQIGLRHDLPVVNVMAPDGSISDQHGWEDAVGSDAETFLGMDRFEAREAIVEWFRTENLLADVRDYAHEVGHSYRSHVPIEPYLSDQWYIAVKKPIASLTGERAMAGIPADRHAEMTEQRDGTVCLKGTDVPVNSLAGLALAPLMDGRLTFVPDRYEKNYRTWLENLRDWPISRQLWWGHRIPVWTQDLQRPSDVPADAVDGHGCDAEVLEALNQALGGDFQKTLSDCQGSYQLRAEPHPEQAGWVRTWICTGPDSEAIESRIVQAGWQQDPDVLDTWFSSALWPFSTLGWPDDTPEMDTFYPGDVLCTAREIITLWVSRMVMMGQYCAGDIPFHTVFIHAMIQDGEGRKMSKSLGTGVDPLVVIESHGADAMRFTLASMTTQTQDVRMKVEPMELPDGRTVNTSPKFDIGRNFCNKLWNASRFVLMRLEGCPPWSDVHAGAALADRWILSRLNQTVGEVTEALHGYRYNELADALYRFMWNDYCDWYVEIAKSRIASGEQAPKAILAHCLDVLLRLLHPVAPFITEAIWARLNEVAPTRGPGDTQAEPMLVRGTWPRADAAAIDPRATGDFAALQELIREIRNARSQHNVPPSQAVDALIEADGEPARLARENLALLASQAGLGEVTITDEPTEAPSGSAAVTAGGLKAFILGIIDVQAEKARLTKQKEQLLKGIRGIEGKLANSGFVEKAPADVVQRERDRLVQLQSDLAVVDRSLESLG